jgi:hypothetical protein
MKVRLTNQENPILLHLIFPNVAIPFISGSSIRRIMSSHILLANKEGWNKDDILLHVCCSALALAPLG